MEKTVSFPFSSFIFYSKLSSITMTSSTNGSIPYIFCEVSTTSCNNLSKSFTFSSENNYVPQGYYRLNLLNTNKFYTLKSLLTSADLTCPSPALTCFKNDKAITCLNNNYLLPDQTCAATCDSNKNPTYISGLTSAQNSGFCNNDCGSTNTCLHNFNNYNNNFSCIGNFTKLYLFCYKNEDKPKGAIHYGQYFNSPNFSYNVSPTLDNYLFEVWFYPDKRFITDSTDTNLLVLLTSGITIKKASLTAENDYMLYDSTGNALGSAFTLKQNIFVLN